jgi:hypothetical protein
LKNAIDVVLTNFKSLCNKFSRNDWLANEHVRQTPRHCTFASLYVIVPSLADSPQISNELTAESNRMNDRSGGHRDNRVSVAESILRECQEIVVSVRQDSCRNGNRRFRGEPPIAKDCVHERSTRPSVAINERVDGLELRMG